MWISDIHVLIHSLRASMCFIISSNMRFHHCWCIIWVLISALVESIACTECGLFDKELCLGHSLIRLRTAEPFFVCLRALNSEFAWFWAVWLLILISEICGEEILLCIVIKGDTFACVDQFTGFKDAYFTTARVRNLPLHSIEFSVYLVLFFDSQTIEKVGYAFAIICSFCKGVLHSKGVTAYYLPRNNFNRFSKLNILRHTSRYAGALAPLNLRGAHHCTCSVVAFSVRRRRCRSDFGIELLLRIFVNPLCSSALNRRLVLLSVNCISKLFWLCGRGQSFFLRQLLLIFFLSGGRQVCRLNVQV